MTPQAGRLVDLIRGVASVVRQRRDRGLTSASIQLSAPAAGTLFVVRRRLAAAAMLFLIGATLAGCEPYPVPPDKTEASISISVGAAGGADTRLAVCGRDCDRTERRLPSATAAASLR